LAPILPRRLAYTQPFYCERRVQYGNILRPFCPMFGAPVFIPLDNSVAEMGRHRIRQCAFGWLAHSRNSRQRLFTEDTQ